MESLDSNILNKVVLNARVADAVKESMLMIARSRMQALSHKDLSSIQAVASSTKNEII
jgi:BioD-like phosphotransacetylase family protein